MREGQDKGRTREGQEGRQYQKGRSKLDEAFGAILHTSQGLPSACKTTHIGLYHCVKRPDPSGPFFREPLALPI